MILNDDECRTVYNDAMELPGRSAVSVTRAVEAAVIRKLAAGVSVGPKYFAERDFDYYTPEQFTTATAAARVQENERIAQHFDAKPGCEMFGGGIADEIRALLGKEST